MRPGGKVSIDIADGSQSVTKTVSQLLGTTRRSRPMTFGSSTTAGYSSSEAETISTYRPMRWSRCSSKTASCLNGNPGLMGELVTHGYSYLTDSDLKVIAAHLRSLEPP